MDSVKSRNEWIFGNINKNIIHDKEYLIKMEVIKMLQKSTQMFDYENLPDDIDKKDLETILQVGGHAVLTVVDGKAYAFRSGLGGMPNPYYLPTIATVANPALNFSKNLKIDEECVVALNDYYYQGMMPLFTKYANLIVDAELSLRQAIINARVPAIITAETESGYESATKFFEDIENCKTYGVVSDVTLTEGIESHDFFKVPHIKELIEGVQYLKGSWYNEIGINATFNMKREAINEFEAGMNEDLLIPTLDMMLECREKAFRKFNDMYGYNVKVKLGSIWATNREADKLATEYQKAEINNLESEVNTDENNRDDKQE